MLEIILNSGLGRCDRLDALRLALFDDAGYILGDVFGEGEDAAVANGGVGPEEL